MASVRSANHKGFAMLRKAIAAFCCAIFLGQLPVEASQDDVDKALEDLERMMKDVGAPYLPKIYGLRRIKTIPSPIPGVDALVYDAMVDVSGVVEPQRIVLYADKSREYLLFGGIINVKKNEVLDREILRAALDKDLSLASLQRVSLWRLKTPAPTVTLVVDLGREKSVELIRDIMEVRDRVGVNIDLALVTTPDDEASVGASAIIAGSSGQEFFFEALSQWIKDGKKAAFLDPERLKKDPEFIARMGRGIWHLENNTSALIAADVRRLPLVFLVDGQNSKLLQTPTTSEGWMELFRVR